MSDTYKLSYSGDSVYGKVVSLVSKHGCDSGVHLDIGCGYGPIAEPIKSLGLNYIGLDRDDDGLEDLRSRGFEVETINLEDMNSVIEKINLKLNGRHVSSISLIDCLEHIVNGLEVLTKLWEYANNRSILLVVAVPNVGHRDLAFKLLGGRWDYTRMGLLDHTHVIHHTDHLLNQMALLSGWAEVDRSDFRQEISDQSFPHGHPFLSESTPIGRYLRDIRSNIDEFGTVNEFVRAYLPRGSKMQGSQLKKGRFEQQTNDSPFLSIITRTQGKRLGNLRDVLLCLAAQTCQNFELIIVAHKTDFETTNRIKRLAEDCPYGLRSKIQVCVCDHGTRTTPLNFGFEIARGDYVAILDDDELIFAHWVATFCDLASKYPGKVIRTVSAEQDIVSTGITENGTLGFRAIGPIRTPYPSAYDFIAHLEMNYSPPLSLIFPRLAFSELGCRFDEELNTAEDWDFEMRVAFLCGVEGSREITAIYRKWQSGESSFSIHSQDEWKRDYDRIFSRLDVQYRIFPPGTVGRLVGMQKWIRKLEADIENLKSEINFINGSIRQDAIRQGAVRKILSKTPRVRSILHHFYTAMPNNVKQLVNRLV